MNVCFASIVSANYLAYAKVLGASVAMHVPGAHYRVLVVDRPTEAVRDAVARSELNVTYAPSLPIADFEALAYKYDLVEFNTALKPSFLKLLFAEGFDQVVYLDPDIRLFEYPHAVFNALDCSNIVLTPHALAPALDGLRPSDVDFLRNGAFNLGFIGLTRGPDSYKLLDWWESRCLTYGFNDLGFGTFVDQKWIDLVPAYFESVQILRHPGCNVAYWNLHERSIHYQNGRYVVGSVPLLFFHFSGVRARAPALLSKHQTRHELVAGTALSEMVAQYCAALLQAGHDDYSKLPYTFGVLDDGTPITSVMRRASVCDGMADARPFSPTSPLQRRLRHANIAVRAIGKRNMPANTLNFDQGTRTVKAVNISVRMLTRIVGVERFQQLLRYGALLTRESHYASVLLNKPLDLLHRDRR